MFLPEHAAGTARAHRRRRNSKSRHRHERPAAHHPLRRHGRRLRDPGAGQEGIEISKFTESFWEFRVIRPKRKHDLDQVNYFLLEPGLELVEFQMWKDSGGSSLYPHSTWNIHLMKFLSEYMRHA